MFILATAITPFQIDTSYNSWNTNIISKTQWTH